MRRARWVAGVAGSAIAVALGLPGWPAAHTSLVAPAQVTELPSTAPPSTPGTTVAATTTTMVAKTAYQFAVGTVDLQAVNAAADLPVETRTGVQGLLDRYLNTAVVAPLKSAHPVTDLSNVFYGPALDRLQGPDRAALVDDGLPGADDIEVPTATADLTALIGPSGLSVLVAGIRLVVHGKVGTGALTIERTGELQLSQEGGSWKVIGYDIRVSRQTPEGVTTATTR